MCPAIQLNRHRGLGPDELTRKYRKVRDAHHGQDEDDLWGWYDYDDCWDPHGAWTADDYTVLAALEETIGFACKKPKLGELLPGALARAAEIEPPPAPREAQPRHAPEELGEALFAHVQRVLHQARVREPAFGDEIETALSRVNGGMGGVAEAFARFEGRPGPIVVSLLFAPFWVRPLASWRAPPGDDAEVTRSLIEHLFQVYPVPRALQQPWLAGGLPSLKWISWLVLLGQGGNLHRAARLFRWNVGKRFTHHFSSAPEDLTALEAAMWAEVARLGGDRVDLDRLRRNPAYAIDPTEAPLEVPEPLDTYGDERREEADRVARTRVFWNETAAWLVRWSAQLTDDSSAAILEWAMHRHTESLRRWPVSAPFTWSGREPASAHATALEYQRLRETAYGDLAWRARGLDWESGEGEAIAWTLRELTSSKALAEESRAMHHCVASYAHRCAHGHTAIFSLCADGGRKITVELDPFHHRIVQARGPCNRAATHEEQAVLARWLAATAAKARASV